MATLKQTIRVYLATLAAGTGLTYGYVNWHCRKLREAEMDIELIQAKKDMTRPQNEYYGINWGYRSDETIEQSLDTGDLLFFDYECHNCFSPKEMALCYKRKLLDGLEKSDPINMAFCLRTPKKLLVVYGDLTGDIKIHRYSELLAKPYIKQVFAKSLENHPPNIVEKALEVVEELKATKQRNEDQPRDFFSQLTKNRISQHFIYDKFGKNVVPYFLWKTNIMKVNPLDPRLSTVYFVKDLSSKEPETINKGYRFASPLMIRTKSSFN